MQNFPISRFTDILCLGIFLAACTESEQINSELKAPVMPYFKEANLIAGRSVWMGTCRNCHLMGVSNAPAVTDNDAWSQRIKKEKKMLYSSALNGIKDEAGKFRMPPRGGNPRLSDEQVKRAVAYMVSSVNNFKTRRQTVGVVHVNK